MELTTVYSVQPMRIALVTDGVFPLAVGGMQGHSANLARHLARQGAEVTLYNVPGWTASTGPSDTGPTKCESNASKAIGS